jgi:hypothetical protein
MNEKIRSFLKNKKVNKKMSLNSRIEGHFLIMGKVSTLFLVGFMLK